jgi:hypothetical protein
MTDHPISGMLALGPVRGAVESLEQVLALPELAGDMIVIVGDESAAPEKRETYRRIFTALGRARRPVVWIPGRVDGALDREVRRAYEAAQGAATARRARILLFMPGVPPSELGKEAEDIVEELMHTFQPRFAARAERPALYVLRDHGGSDWLEV